MISKTGGIRLRVCNSAELGVDHSPDGSGWPAGEVLLVSDGGTPDGRYMLALRTATLEGAALTKFLASVSPFGCPPPHSLVRAYSLPDAPYPSILLEEHGEAPNGMGEAYQRFAARSRQRWLAALQETGPGLCPAVAWHARPTRRFVALDACAAALGDHGVSLPGVADSYLGRGLLLLADPRLADSWNSMMSLGGVTKARKITGREFPVWVDLPAHQPSLLASPLLPRVEQLLADV